MVRHMKTCGKTQVKCRICQTETTQNDAPLHNCSGTLKDRLVAKDKELESVKAVLSKVTKKLEHCFNQYYPKEYVEKDDEKARTVSGYEFYRKE